MPKVQVPRYSPNQIDERPVSGPRVSVDAPLEAFGGGQSLQNVSNANRALNQQTLDIVVREKQNADQVMFLDADNQLAQKENDILYNKDTGALNKRGKDTFGLHDTVNDEFTKAAAEIEKNLKNDNQRASFRRSAQSRQMNLNKQIDVHVGQERRAFDDAQTQASIANDTNDAVLNYGDPVRVAMALENQRAKIIDKANRNGLPDEWTKMTTDQTFSKTHSAVIDQMLADGNDLAADQYFKENKDEILSDDRVKLEKALHEGAVLGDAQRNADEIFLKSDNRNEAFEKAKKIKDPELRKETEAQLERMFTRQSTAERQDSIRQFNLASDIVEQGSKPPANIWANLNATQRGALDARLKQVVAGVQPSTDWATYYNLKTMASEQKNEFTKENLMQYRHVLADAEFKDLANLQGQLNKNDAGAQASLNGYRTSKQIIDDTLISAGYKPNSKKPDEMRRVANFRRMVDEQVSILQDQTQKKAKSEDIQRIADNLLINRIVKHGGFLGLSDSNKRTFELSTKDVAVDDIPVMERAKIESFLRRRQLPITQENVIGLYIKKLQGWQ